VQKTLKILGAAPLALAFGLATTLGAVLWKPRLAVGAIQWLVYHDQQVNLMEPHKTPQDRVHTNGIRYRSDITYGSTFPNSHLDIAYPTADTTVRRPTILYWHGGGFFGGDKAMGDPPATSSDSRAVFEALLTAGYNLVSINYALVPDHHFPDPVVQMNQAVNYLTAHARELGLDMDDVILFGQSAGAIMVSQYGAILTNADYRAMFPLTEQPRLSTRAIRAMVVDDAPLVNSNMQTFAVKILIGNYLGDSALRPDPDKVWQYNPIPYMSASYPRSLFLAGTVGGFPADMQQAADKLNAVGSQGSYFLPDEARYGKTHHTYLSNLGEDITGAADAALAEILKFIRT
jgi:acetyl esterase/lipase